MGNALSVSRARTESITQALNEAITENINTCSLSATGNIEFKSRGTNNSVITSDQSIKLTASVTCLASTENLNKLDIKLQEKIRNQSKAQTESGFFLGWRLNYSEAVIKEISETVNRSIVKNVNTCKTRFNIGASIDIQDDTGSVFNIIQDNSGNAAMNCLFTNKNLTDLSQDISKNFDNGSEASPGASAMMPIIIAVVVIVILAIVGVVIYFVIRNKQKGTNNPAPPDNFFMKPNPNMPQPQGMPQFGYPPNQPSFPQQMMTPQSFFQQTPQPSSPYMGNSFRQQSPFRF